MGNVMVIPAKRQVGNNIKKAERPKLRVAAYCRVSTDSDEQATSYEAQIEHYTDYISKNSDGCWQAYSQTTESQVRTPKSVTSLIA